MMKLIQTFPNEEKFKLEYEDSVKFPLGIFVFFERILEILRNDHNLLCKLLSITNSNEHKQIFGKFFASYLNSNFFSKMPLQDEYMLLLTRMLQQEINKKPSIEEFLSDGSICKYLLSELYKVDEIKNYFIQIIQPCIAEIECWKNEISFLLTSILETKEHEKEKNNNSNNTNANSDIPFLSGDVGRETINIIESNENANLEQGEMEQDEIGDTIENKNKDNAKNQQFKDSYLKNLNATTLFDFINKEKSEDTKTYLSKHIEAEDKSEEKMIFAIETFLYNLKEENSNTADLYIDRLRNNFEKCKKIITKIISKMKKHNELVPNSIRSILKIIECLLKKKFTSINNVDLYGYLSCFFINLLMEPMLTIHPDKNGLIDSTLLTPITQHNIQLLVTIIKQFCKGEMFSSSEDSGLSVFNIFFIQNYKDICEFYNNILLQTKVPSIIEELILSKNKNTNTNDTNDNNDTNENIENYDYVYNYFQRNPKEHIRGILYFIDLNFVVNFIEFLYENKNLYYNTKKDQHQDKEKDKFLRLALSLDKCYSQDKLNKLKKMLITTQEQKKRMFFGTFTEDYSPVFTKIKSITEHPIQFKLPDQKEPINKNHSIIITIKNCLCKLLYNAYSLENSCLTLNTNNLQTKDIVLLLTKANILNYASFDNDNEIIWCGNTLTDSIGSLSDEYKKNDYALIYEEIINELYNEKNELKSYYDVVSTLNETMRHVAKRKEAINLMWKCAKEDQISQAVKRLIMENNSFIYHIDVVDKKSKITVTLKMEYKPQKGKNLFSFCEDFPDLNKLYNKQNRKPFNSLKTLLIYDLLKTCFLKIKKSIIDSYFSFELFKLVQSKPLQLNQHEMSFYNEEQRHKIIQDIIARDDREIKEKFTKECNYKKKTKTENTFYLHDIPLINKLHDLLKEFVMNRLYGSLFPKNAIEHDVALKEKFDALSLLCKPSSLNKETHNESIIIASVPKAKKYIKRFDNERTPLSKKRAFIKLLELIKHIINFNKKESSKISAVDDTVPILIFFLIKAAPERYYSSVRYLECFWSLFEEPDQAMLSLMKAPKMFLLHVEPHKFENVSNQNDFDKILEEALTAKSESHHSRTVYQKGRK